MGSATPATPGADFVSSSGTVPFTPGQTSKTVTIYVKGDTTSEPDETFQVVLSSPVNATLGTNPATATIQNDDAPQLAAGTPPAFNAGATISSVPTALIQAAEARWIALGANPALLTSVPIVV